MSHFKKCFRLLRPVFKDIVVLGHLNISKNPTRLQIRQILGWDDLDTSLSILSKTRMGLDDLRRPFQFLLFCDSSRLFMFVGIKVF